MQPGSRQHACDASSRAVKGLARFFVIGDGGVLENTARRMGLASSYTLIDLDNVPARTFEFGVSRPSFGKASVDYLDKALELLAEGSADSLVTAPVNKSSIRSAGFSDFEGHTQYLAHRTRTKEFAMMFVGKQFKITLVTRHMALKDVPRRLTRDSIFARYDLPMCI